MKRCRSCIHWVATRQWKGNCRIYQWPWDRYSEDATATGCQYYEDKYTPVVTGDAQHYERRHMEVEG